MSYNLHHAALAASILLTVVAQILLKLGANPGSGRLNIFLLAGLSNFGLVTILMVYALQAIELKTLIAFSSLTFVAMPIAAKYILNERVSTRQFAGSVVILLGLLVFLSGG